MLSEALLGGRFKGKNLIKIDVQNEEHLNFEGEQLPEFEKKKEVVESK